MICLLALLAAGRVTACSNGRGSNTPSSTTSSNPTNSPTSNMDGSQTESQSSSINDDGKAWPDTWPSGDIPKIDGTVDYVYDGGIDTLTGITVNITIQDESVATAYTENLVSSGFELVSDVKLDGGFNRTLKSKGYSSIVCIYSDEDSFFLNIYNYI